MAVKGGGREDRVVPAHLLPRCDQKGNGGAGSNVVTP